MFSNGSPNKLKDFQFSNMTTTPVNEQDWIQNKCIPLANMTQCSTLAPTVQTSANSGQNMVNFLRGQTGFEATAYRDRQFSLGDTVNAVPLYVGRPRLSFGDAVTPDYPTWAAGMKNRTPALYVGANDGMLHVFNGNTGAELWAYVPRMSHKTCGSWLNIPTPPNICTSWTARQYPAMSMTLRPPPGRLSW